MACAGRSYLNLSERNVLYCNFGHSTTGVQMYPNYPGGLEEHGLGQRSFSKIMTALQDDIERNGAAFEFSCAGWCRFLLSPCTLCLSYCWATHHVSKWVTRLTDVVQRNNTSRVKVEIVQIDGKSLTAPQWMDSSGNILTVERDNRPWGSPIGFNVVFTLATPVEQWPPTCEYVHNAHGRPILAKS